MMAYKNGLGDTSISLDGEGGGGYGESDSHDDARSLGGSVSTVHLVKGGINRAPHSDGQDGRGRHAEQLARRETYQVRVSKLLVFVVLMIAAGVMGYFTYKVFSDQERENFETEFRTYGNELLDSSIITAQNIFATIESMSFVISSYAIASNSTWPCVTIPDYAYRGSHLLELSGSKYLGFLPLITAEDRPKWENYSVANQGWLYEPLPESLLGDEQDQDRGSTRHLNGPPSGDSVNIGDGDEWAESSSGSGGSGGFPTGIMPYIFRFDAETFRPVNDTSIPDPYYAVFWQITPPVPTIVNLNVLSSFGDAFVIPFKSMLAERKAVFSQTLLPEDTANFTDTEIWPNNYLLQPIHKTLSKQSPIVALYSAVIPWHTYFERVVPDEVGSLVVVISNTCNQTFSYQVDGPDVTFLGNDDMHNSKYSGMNLTGSFDVLDQLKSEGICKYTINVYPTSSLEDAFISSNPWWYMLAVVLIFVVTSGVFILYDCFVQIRQNKVMDSAVKTNAIVSSMFPAQFRARVIEDDAAKNMTAITHQRLVTSKFDDGEHEKARLLMSKPIADLFPSVTVMFADIADFTAWSSVREPSQVFMLLEQIYSSFDVVAKRRQIFKVETIGDCYVAACGLPTPRKDHAVAMVSFARECLRDMTEAVQSLEVLLGPDTADLTMRFGLHSGPVTAGVLRGEKTRFQLFGDTVNTAARMESSGARNQIHISSETAAQLKSCGKGHWAIKRENVVHIKGKGDVQTYWASARRAGTPSVASAKEPVQHGNQQEQNAGECSASQQAPPDQRRPIVHTHPNQRSKQTEQARKTQRLIEWNVEVLQGLLQKIIAMRSDVTSPCTDLVINTSADSNSTVLDEVKEIIELPGKAAKYQQDPNAIELHPQVIQQLEDYVSSIARMYRQNAFHSFDHASHVVQSVTKILSRVVTPDSIDYHEMAYKQPKGAAKLHEYTYGITSDPLTQFACAFSALIHDVDHSGVPNAVLVNEQTDLASHYKNKSVAEQNSVDLAWELLNQPEFQALRACIYSTKEELCRFRQLVVNSVMATDIMDKDLGSLRKARWDKAFAEDERLLEDSDDPTATPSSTTSTTKTTSQSSQHRRHEESSQVATNRKATIVIEHLIQASDVSHTMQHWHIFVKWNERLFHEMYAAFKAGRLEKDPSEGWYEGELGFFDFYLIPLAKKLATCGVFGVTSDEYLLYAEANRQEWQKKGKEIVEGYLSHYGRH